MKSKVKYLLVMFAIVLSAIVCVACSSDMDTGNTSSSSEVKDAATENVSSTKVASEVSSETVSSKPASSEDTISSDVTSKEVSSQPTSSIPNKTQSSVKDKPKATSSKSTNSKPTSSKPVKEPASSESPNFGERMDEAEVDRIIAEGIEYAESKGMTWYEDFSIEGSGYYNPAFSGAGAEIFKRDLFYHIDQLYDIIVNDPYYYEGGGIAYKIVKGEFEEPGYWYGFVLY